jgi:hypothetical protein
MLELGEACRLTSSIESPQIALAKRSPTETDLLAQANPGDAEASDEIGPFLGALRIGQNAVRNSCYATPPRTSALKKG